MFIALRKENYAVAKKGLIWGFMMVGVDVAIFMGILAVESYLLSQYSDKWDNFLDATDRSFNNRLIDMENCVRGWGGLTRSHCLTEALDRNEASMNHLSIKYELKGDSRIQMVTQSYNMELRDYFYYYCSTHNKSC